MPREQLDLLAWRPAAVETTAATSATAAPIPRPCPSTCGGRRCERDDDLHFATGPEDQLHMAGLAGTPQRLMWHAREADEHRDNATAAPAGRFLGVLPCRHIEMPDSRNECGKPARIYDDGDPAFAARFGMPDGVEAYWRGDCPLGHVERYWPRRYRRDLARSAPSEAA